MFEWKAEVEAICRSLHLNPHAITLDVGRHPVWHPSAAKQYCGLACPDGRVWIKSGMDDETSIHVLAHELRHVCQFANGWLTSTPVGRAWFGDTGFDMEDYDNLPWELDADLWADAWIGQYNGMGKPMSPPFPIIGKKG